MLTRLIPIFSKIKAIRQHGRMLWEAFKHPQTPKWIKGLMIATGAYLISPIDLVPDFALILGLTDDAIVLTVMMWALGYLIPAPVQADISETLARKGKVVDAAEASPAKTSRDRAHSSQGPLKKASTVGSGSMWIWGAVALGILAVAVFASQSGFLN